MVVLGDEVHSVRSVVEVTLTLIKEGELVIEYVGEVMDRSMMEVA